MRDLKFLCFQHLHGTGAAAQMSCKVNTSMYTLTTTLCQGFLNGSTGSRKHSRAGKLGHSMLCPTRRRPPSLRALVECGVFGVGLFQNGNVRICILPQCEKVLVGGACLCHNGRVGG